MPNVRNQSLGGRADQAGLLYAAGNTPATFQRTLMPRATMGPEQLHAIHARLEARELFRSRWATKHKSSDKGLAAEGLSGLIREERAAGRDTDERLLELVRGVAMERKGCFPWSSGSSPGIPNVPVPPPDSQGRMRAGRRSGRPARLGGGAGGRRHPLLRLGTRIVLRAAQERLRVLREGRGEPYNPFAQPFGVAF